MDNLNSHSYSMVSVANKCLRLYKLQFIDKHPFAKEESSALDFGTAVHSALQATLEGGNGEEVFHVFWESVKDKDMKFFRHSWDDLSQIGSQLVGRFGRLHAKNFKIKRPMEQRLFGELGGYNIEGTPDFIGEYKGVPSIVDFKTSSQVYTPDKLVVSDQLHLYRHLVKQQLGYDAKQLVYLVLNKHPVRIQSLVTEVDENQHKEVLENIRVQIEELEKRSIWPQNKQSCLVGGKYRCSAWDVCHGSKNSS